MHFQDFFFLHFHANSKFKGKKLNIEKVFVHFSEEKAQTKRDSLQRLLELSTSAVILETQRTSICTEGKEAKSLK